MGTKCVANTQYECLVPAHRRCIKVPRRRYSRCKDFEARFRCDECQKIKSPLRTRAVRTQKLATAIGSGDAQALHVDDSALFAEVIGRRHRLGEI